MKKSKLHILLFFSLLILFGCGNKGMKNKKIDSESRINKISKSEDKGNVIDTIYFSNNAQKNPKDFALVSLLEKKYVKDSICNAKFVIDFIKNSEKVFSYPVNIKGFDVESEWFGEYQLDSISSPLRVISVGFPACGYIQNNFLFYVEKDHSSLIHNWNSMADGQWGSWGEIVSGKPNNFYYRYTSFWGEENGEQTNEDIGILEYSDSIHFEIVNDKWVKIFLTPKDKVYRSKRQTFEEFNKEE